MKHGGKRPGAGRKTFEAQHGEKPVKFTVYLTQSQHDWLTSESERVGVSIAEFIRQLIDAASPE